MIDFKENIVGCEYEQGILHKLIFRQFQNLHKSLFFNNTNYYLKPDDIISYRPTLFGYHEPHLEKLFGQLAKTHSDFLLDVGANIGLTSIFVGANFKEIHCVEPNKTLVKILDVNLELAKLLEKTTIYPIGLGPKDGIETLLIPDDNFGAGFVAKGNAYNGQNDSMQRQEKKHTEKEIQIKDAKKWFSSLFSKNSSWSKGAVKIDVEGLELPIFQALLEALPSDMSIIVVMENFLDQVNFEEFNTKFHNLSWFGFYKEKSFLKSIPFKLIGMSSYYKQTVRKIRNGDKAPHDLIICIEPKNKFANNSTAGMPL